MGYTHHWYRPSLIDAEIFRKIRADFEKLILPLADIEVLLAGWDGENEPEINDERICFNGVCKCGHKQNEEIVIPYPAENARGIGPSGTAIAGPWYNVGVALKHRCCGGECCHETFFLPREASDRAARTSAEDDEDAELVGLAFYWTKTAFKPYDIAVTAALLIAKRYLREKLVIHGDGDDPQWADAKELCQEHLGYGTWFSIVDDPKVEIWTMSDGAQKERYVTVHILVEMDPSTFRS